MTTFVLAYRHNQAVAATLWTINHNLDRHPVVQTYDTDGVQIEGEVTSVSVNQATVEFGVAVAGTAVCR